MSHRLSTLQKHISASARTMAPKILLHGSGAIGSVYVYLLSKAGYDITAVLRSNYEAVKANGFVMDSEMYGQGQRFHPKVVQTPAEAAPDGPYDYVIVAAKAIPDAEISKTIAPVVNRGKTTIALIQNGIGIEDEYVKAFPENPLLSCVVYLPTTQISPGHIRMGNFESLEVGAYPSSAYTDNPEVKAAADRFMEILKHAGSNAKWFDDVQEKRWNKLLFNAPLNPICALTLSRDTAYMASSPEAIAVIEAVMLEVVQVAQALGYDSVKADTVEDWIHRAGGRMDGEGIEPSMLVDAVSGRRMEADVILGGPVKVAKKLGVKVPRLETLYALTKALDEANTYRQPGQSLKGDEAAAARKKREQESAPSAG